MARKEIHEEQNTRSGSKVGVKVAGSRDGSKSRRRNSNRAMPRKAGKTRKPETSVCGETAAKAKEWDGSGASETAW